MSLRAVRIAIENVGCFESIEMQFNRGFNIICGQNGIGKTTILEALSSLYATWHGRSLTRNANASSGKVHFEFLSNESQLHQGEAPVNRWLPEDNTAGFSTGLEHLVKEFIYIKASRDILYKKLTAVSRDEEKNESVVQQGLPMGLINDDLKNWFVNRYIFFDKVGSLSEMQIGNYKLALESMSLLDSTVNFSTVDASTFNIMLRTRDGVIPMEYLSSGYRTTFYTILGIIKELELRRYPESANRYSGIVLIDEVDLHLHPEWQRKIVDILRQSFPLAQFIVTTHSPHVIQMAGSGEVIALIRGPHGRPQHNHLPELPYGFQGWTVEEILEDVMGLPTTKSAPFDEAMQQFESALLQEDEGQLRTSLDTLELMLHPSSPIRKLLRLQAGPVLG